MYMLDIMKWCNVKTFSVVWQFGLYPFLQAMAFSIIIGFGLTFGYMLAVYFLAGHGGMDVCTVHG